MSAILEKAWTWIAESKLEKDTLARYIYSLGQFARLGVLNIDQITKRSFMDFARMRTKEGIGANTINRDLAAISSFCRWLWERDEFPLGILLELRELYQNIPPPPTPDYLSPEKYLALRVAAAGVHPTLELAITLAVHSGLRFGELRRLWFEDLSLATPSAFIRIDRSHGRETKTKKSRTVPLRRCFADELKNRYQFTPLLAGPIFRPRLRRGEILQTPYLHDSTFRGWLYEARRRAGFYCNWVTFRHTFASWHIQSGTSIAKVAKWCGHSISVCFAHYSALLPGGDTEIEKGFHRLLELETDGEDT